MNVFFRHIRVKTNVIRYCSRQYTTAKDVEQYDYVLLENDTEDPGIKEKEIQSMCNKSRLSEPHQRMLRGKAPHTHMDPKSDVHLNINYNRKIYAKYGEASCVNPVICWPSQEEMDYRLGYEKVASVYNIKEFVAAAQEKRKQENIKKLEWDNEMATRFSKLESWKDEIRKKIAKKTAEIEAARLKKHRLIEEVRREFGFTLDPKSEKFQELVAKRAKEQKKKERQEKQEAKEKQLIAKLQQQSAEMDK